jgi:hypothetical protein
MSAFDFMNIPRVAKNLATTNVSISCGFPVLGVRPAPCATSAGLSRRFSGHLAFRSAGCADRALKSSGATVP